MTEEEDKRDDVSGRRHYDNPNAALDRHIKTNDARLEANDRRLKRFFIRALIAISIIGFFTAAGLAGFGIVLNEQQKTQDQLQVAQRQLTVLVKQNKDTAAAIQKQRKDSIRSSCEETNARYIGSRDALIKGSDEDQANAPDAAARKEIRRRRDVTLALLKALQPFKNCDEEVAKAVKPTTGG